MHDLLNRIHCARTLLQQKPFERTLLQQKHFPQHIKKQACTLPTRANRDMAIDTLDVHTCRGLSRPDLKSSTMRLNAHSSHTIAIACLFAFIVLTSFISFLRVTNSGNQTRNNDNTPRPSYIKIYPSSLSSLNSRHTF